MSAISVKAGAQMTAPEHASAERERPARAPRVTPRGPAAAFPLGRVAVALSVLGALITPVLGTDPFQNPDSRSFEAIARSLLAGAGFMYHEVQFPELPFLAFRSPAYSAFVACALALGGVPALVAMQGALHGLSAALTGAVAGRLGGVRAGGLATALAFAWPVAWFHAGQVMSETLHAFLTVLAVWLVLQAGRHRPLGWAVAAGAVLGLGVLNRPAGVAAVAAGALWLVMRDRRAALACVLSALLVWMPWPARNAVRLHAFVPLLTSGGVAAWNMHSRLGPDAAWAWMAGHTELGEVALDRHFRDEAARIVRENPGGFARFVAHGLVEYAGPLRAREPDVWLHRFALLAALPALLWAGWRRRLALPALVWVSQGLVLVPLAMNARYRFPTEWCVMVAAGIGLHALAERIGTGRAALAAGAALALCVTVTRLLARP
ncbi:MAG: hypothetical protein ABL977_16955 [Candidatus Eisenbacteria bacterium]